MGKVKRNYSNVERKDGPEPYAGDPPKPGIYDFVLTTCKEHTPTAGGEGIEWIFEISEGPYKGWPGWQYTNDSSTAWKEMAILEALGLLTPGDTSLDLTHEQIVKKAGPVRGKIKNEEYDGENRPKLQTILAPPGGAAPKKGKKEKSSDGPF